MKVLFRFGFGRHNPIRFHYEELLDCGANLNGRIRDAFGPEGLGVCVVHDIPYYVKLRQSLLPQAYRLAHLGREELRKLERPEAFHSKGWSCGVEQFKGKADFSKGSLYNNPLYDQSPPLSWEEQRQLGEGVKLRIDNVWPESLSDLESAFKSLGRLMVDTGALLAYHIDKMVKARNQEYEMGKLYRFVKQGDQHTGRLLHYYEDDSELDTDWCGWHNDHSALTALTAPIYINQQGQVVDGFKDVDGGLLAKNRFGEITQVGLQEDCLAFQIGETAQIVSGGIVEATPHSVVRGKESRRLKYNRNTFAVFMAPRFNEVLNVPSNMNANDALNKQSYNVPSLIGRWHPNINYLDYSYNSYKSYSSV